MQRGVGSAAIPSACPRSSAQLPCHAVQHTGLRRHPVQNTARFCMESNGAGARGKGLHEQPVATACLATYCLATNCLATAQGQGARGLHEEPVVPRWAVGVVRRPRGGRHRTTGQGVLAAGRGVGGIERWGQEVLAAGHGVCGTARLPKHQTSWPQDAPRPARLRSAA